MQGPILLISSNADRAYIIELRTELAVQVVEVANLRAGLRALKEQMFCLLILDSKITDHSMKLDLITRTAGVVPTLEVDLKEVDSATLLGQVRLTLSRFSVEQIRARNAAIAQLQGELRDSLAGLLLESQLALREVDASKHPKLVSVVQIATSLGARLKLEADWQRVAI